jgi:hypothetical protein
MMVKRAVVTGTATMWAMATVTRLVGKDKGRGKGSKDKFDGNEGGGHWRGQGRQGDGDCDMGGKPGDGNNDDKGHGDENKGGG